MRDFDKQIHALDHCPECQSENLSDSSQNQQDTTIYYERACEDCGSTFALAFELDRVLVWTDGEGETTDTCITFEEGED